jgi:hypothetical protein
VSKNKILKMPGGARQPKIVTIPSKEDVQAEARRAVLPDLSRVAESLGERIAILYAETAKSAVILNSLAELLISKKIISKDELQDLSLKNGKDLEDQYKKAVEKAKEVDPGVPSPALPQEKPDGGQPDKPTGTH